MDYQADGWIRIEDTTDFQPVADAPTQLYVIACRTGKIRIGYPWHVTVDSKGAVQDILFDTMASGAQGTIYGSEVIALLPLELPMDIEEEILSNKRYGNTKCHKLLRHDDDMTWREIV